jgi:hypothetical protein
MARAITNQGTALPIGFDADASDAQLLSAVVDYWHRSLLAADDRDVLLGDLGISVDVAESLRIGLSDRTLGLQLPGRQWKAGGILRSRLSAESRAEMMARSLSTAAPSRPFARRAARLPCVPSLAPREPGPESASGTMRSM